MSNCLRRDRMSQICKRIWIVVSCVKSLLCGMCDRQTWLFLCLLSARLSMSHAYLDELYGSIPILCWRPSMLKAERRALLEDVQTILDRWPVLHSRGSSSWIYSKDKDKIRLTFKNSMPVSVTFQTGWRQKPPADQLGWGRPAALRDPPLLQTCGSHCCRTMLTFRPANFWQSFI